MQVKLVFVLWFVVLLQVVCRGQNLVPNPSFEDTVVCPNGTGQVWKAANWYVAEKTPDYFNACCVIAAASVPQNLFDYQYPATGDAYCGFYTYARPDTLYREKIGVELINALSIGSRYFVSFKLNATSRYVNGGSNRTGALFSTVQYTPTNPSPTKDFCQMWTDSIIGDTIHWVQVWGSFTADSAYTYLTLGNFFTNAHTDTISFWPRNFLVAYQFIDDVCVSEDSATCITTPTSIRLLQERKNEVTAYPNPAGSYLNIELNLDHPAILSIITIDGRIFFQQNIPRGSSKVKLDVTDLTSGIYFAKVVMAEKAISRKIIVQH